MLTKIFCEIDDFMQEFEEEYKRRLISESSVKSKINSKLSVNNI